MWRGRQIEFEFHGLVYAGVHIAPDETCPRRHPPLECLGIRPTLRPLPKGNIPGTGWKFSTVSGMVMRNVRGNEITIRWGKSCMMAHIPPNGKNHGSYEKDDPPIVYAYPPYQNTIGGW